MMSVAGLFQLGTVLMTSGIKSLLINAETELNNAQLYALLNRHRLGDDGDVCAEDSESNIYAIEHGERVFSVYKHPDATLWIITEADRSSTTILLPEEY